LRYFRSRFFTFVFFMQKLTGTSSVKNNQSCGIFLPRIQKNWACIFLIFLRLSMQFTRNRQITLLLELLFCSQALEVFCCSQLYPYLCGSALRKKLHLAMWPSEPTGGGPAEIRRGPAAGPVGDGVEGWPRVARGRGGGAGDGARRRRPVPAAAARCPAKDGRGRNDPRLHELW
jgi:hypothetical protein